MATSALTTMTTAMPCEHIEIIIVIVIMITLSLYLAPFPFSLSSPSSPLGVHDDLLFDLPCVPDQKTITMMAIEIMINIMMIIFFILNDNDDDRNHDKYHDENFLFLFFEKKNGD